MANRKAYISVPDIQHLENNIVKLFSSAPVAINVNTKATASALTGGSMKNQMAC